MAKTVLIPYQEPTIIPNPIPNLPLEPPYSDYCLTAFLPSDAPQLLPIFHHPETKRTFPLGGITEEGAVEYVETMIRASRDWPFSGETSWDYT